MPQLLIHPRRLLPGLGASLLAAGLWGFGIETQERASSPSTDLASSLARQDPSTAKGQDAAALDGVVDLGGVYVDTTAGFVAFPVVLEVKDDLLEYLLVAPHGAIHESMLVTGVDAELVNAGLLSLGLQQGTNAQWIPRDPAPTREELRAGVGAYNVLPPTGDGVYLYLGWREGEEVFWYRAEDMVRDTDRLRTMRRHRWVYLGSRMVSRPSRPDESVFAASHEGNWINLPFFADGSTLVTSALEEAEKQNVWLPNAWLLPHRGSGLMLVASRERLAAPPQSLSTRLPLVVEGETVRLEVKRSGGGRHVPQKQQLPGAGEAGGADGSGEGSDESGDRR